MTAAHHLMADADEPLTDAELADAFRGDPARFSVVHDRYFRDIYRYVAGRLGSQQAEDIAADTFCTAFGQRDRFDPGRGGLRAWLFGIATNLVARHTRAEARRYRALSRSGTDAVVGGHEDHVVRAVAAWRMRPRLAGALRTLSRGERDVVLLVALGQLNYQEVGQALGVSPGTVGSRLSRARSKLQHVIDQEEFRG